MEWIECESSLKAMSFIYITKGLGVGGVVEVGAKAMINGKEERKKCLTGR